MASLPAPQSPQYRVSLFYGPEPVDRGLSLVACVFNVKKRSWKGGVQVSVELDEAQVARAKHILDFERWIQTVLTPVAEDERPDYASRAQELLVQGLCAFKLDLAIDAGIQQENSRIAAEAFAETLDQAVRQQSDRVRTYILSELDLAAT